jgi:hypothetical protein
MIYDWMACWENPKEAARKIETDAKVITALREAIEVAVERFEGCGMKYAAEEIRKLRAAAIEQTAGEN